MTASKEVVTFLLFQAGNIEKRNTYKTTIIINIMVRIMRKKEVYLSDMISLNPGSLSL